MTKKPKNEPDPAWKKLLMAGGGNPGVCEALGISQPTLQKITRGQRPFPADPVMRLRLEVLCDDLDVDNPLEKARPPRNPDLIPLRHLGEILEMGHPAAPSEVARLLQVYPTYQLIELAEGKGTPPILLRAVMHLLEQG